MQSTLPKSLDKILRTEFFHHLETIIPKEQHGFVKRRSTVTNSLEITQFIHENMERFNTVDVVYLDYTTAFDQIDHHLLTIKMAKLKKKMHRSGPFLFAKLWNGRRIPASVFIRTRLLCSGIWHMGYGMTLIGRIESSRRIGMDNFKVFSQG